RRAISHGSYSSLSHCTAERAGTLPAAGRPAAAAAATTESSEATAPAKAAPAKSAAESAAAAEAAAPESAKAAHPQSRVAPAAAAKRRRSRAARGRQDEEHDDGDDDDHRDRDAARLGLRDGPRRYVLQRHAAFFGDPLDDARRAREQARAVPAV